MRDTKRVVGHPTDMGKKAPHMRFTLPRACEIEPALIVSCNAIEMRDPDVDVAVMLRRARPGQCLDTRLRLQLDGWRGICWVGGKNAVPGAIVAQHNVEVSFRNREPILKGYALWPFGSHVNRQRTVMVEARS